MRGCFPSLILFTVDTVAVNVQMEVDITIGQLKIREKGGRADRQYISARMHGREFHIIVYQFKAEKIEKIVFQAIAEYIDKLQENEDIFEQISENGRKAKKEKAKELSREQERLKHIQQKISVMEDKIPEAMLGEYPVPVDKLVELIEKQKQEKEQQEKVIAEKQKELDGADVSFNEWDSLRMQIPTWKDVFLNADNPTKRVLVNKLIEKISVKEDEVVIRFKININEIRSKALKKSGSIVPENKLEDKSVILDSLKIYPNPE